LDVVFLLDNRLQGGIERVICEARDKAIEAVKLRWGEENWRPHHAGSRLDKCKKIRHKNKGIPFKLN